MSSNLAYPTKDETAQVQSATKVCEENEVGTNIQVYEIKHKSFAFKVIVKHKSALVISLKP